MNTVSVTISDGNNYPLFNQSSEIVVATLAVENGDEANKVRVNFLIRELESVWDNDEVARIMEEMETAMIAMTGAYETVMIAAICKSTEQAYLMAIGENEISFEGDDWQTFEMLSMLETGNGITAKINGVAVNVRTKQTNKFYGDIGLMMKALKAEDNYLLATIGDREFYVAQINRKILT